MALLKKRLAYFFEKNVLTFRQKVGHLIVMKDELGLEDINLPKWLIKQSLW